MRLKSNGDYWKAAWYNAAGKLRERSIGPKSKYSRRAAKVVCRELEDELGLRPGLRKEDCEPTLLRLCVAYLRGARSRLAPSTYQLNRMTIRYLLAYFGHRTRIAQVTRADAREWRDALANGKLLAATSKAKSNWRRPAGRPMAATTVAKHIRIARGVFADGVDRWGEAWGLTNPFKGIKAPPGSRSGDKDWRYVTPAELQLLLTHSRNTGWQLFLALMRIQGMRRGEALDLRWRHLRHLGEKSMMAFGPVQLPIYGLLDVPGRTVARKTGKSRTMPILREELANLLVTMREQAGPDDLIVPVDQVSRTEIRKPMLTLLDRAQLEPWANLFQVFRRNAETDLANLRLPQYIVSEWIGHRITTSVAYYLPDTFGKSKDLGQNVGQLAMNAITHPTYTTDRAADNAGPPDA